MAREEPTPRQRILIVDDEESTRLLLARMMSKELKAEVHLAGTSVQALRLAESSVYDAILLDILMPGMDGFELLRRIREATPNATTPVIVVSVLSDEKSAERARTLGANAFHVKPVRRAELINIVNRELAAARRAESR
jgi:CheY-like chemotaxis protein